MDKTLFETTSDLLDLTSKSALSNSVNSSSDCQLRSEFLVFGQPEICQEEIDEVVDSLHNSWLGTGPKVARFKNDFAAYKCLPSSEYVVAVNSCTAALHLSLIAADINPGDEVITTPLTFCATVNAIIHSGGIPVLADCDPVTQNILPEAVESKITSRTRAILPVHFAGRPCDMDSLCAIAKKHNLKIIEDCAHAVEAEYSGKKTGTFGDFGCFSFYATKNVSTGEGGMIIARNLTDRQRLERLALHGLNNDAWKRFSDSGFKHYQVLECGYKYNMMDLQAAIGIHQLARVEANWHRRRQIWNQYNAAFANLPVSIPAPQEINTRHALHLYTLQINQTHSGICRDDFLEEMTRQKIGLGVHYLSIPEHPYYRDAFGWRLEDYPNALRIGRETVSLPLSPRLTDQDVVDVIQAVRRVLNCD
jgi:dTDP-4-amino-4,6-dideoxygalactose transaminase